MFVLYVAHAVNTGGSSLFRSIHACDAKHLHNLHESERTWKFL